MDFIRLSSRLTLVYKLVIPLGGITALAGYVWLILAQHWLLELHGVIALFFFALLLLFTTLISLRIRHVAYNDSFIKIRNYGQPRLISTAEYQRLTPGGWFPFDFLYRLYTSTTSPLFLSSFSSTISKVIQLDFALNGPLEPENVVVARKMLTLQSRLSKQTSL